MMNYLRLAANMHKCINCRRELPLNRKLVEGGSLFFYGIAYLFYIKNKYVMRSIYYLINGISCNNNFIRRYRKGVRLLHRGWGCLKLKINSIKSRLLIVSVLILIVPSLVVGLMSYKSANDGLDAAGKATIQNAVTMAMQTIDALNKEVE